MSSTIRGWSRAFARLLVGLVLAGGPLLGGVETAQAASMTVTTTADELNQDGDCSLREALRAANLNRAVDRCPAGTSAVDVITLPAGTYTLTRAGAGENAGATGDLDILSPLTITGAGSETTIIDGNRLDRVMHLLGSARVTLAHLTIRNGDSGASDDGGGIRSKGVLRLEHAVVRDNRSGHYGGGIWSDRALELVFSQVSRNQASTFLYAEGQSDDSDGGGIYIAGGTATISGSDIDHNSASPDPNGGDGGGIFNRGSLTITNSAIRENLVTNEEYESDRSDGGGIFNAGTLTIAQSSVSGNEVVWGQGGGISNLAGATATVTDVHFRSNLAEFDGSAVRNLGRMTITGGSFNEHRNVAVLNGGQDAGTSRTGDLRIEGATFAGNFSPVVLNEHALRLAASTFENNAGSAVVNSGAASIANTTISGGRASAIINSGGTLSLAASTLVDNAAEFGGAIHNQGGMVDVANSTLSGNRAVQSGGAIYNSPFDWMQGAVSITQLNNVTVAFNIADSDNNGGGDGGGVFNGSYGAGHRVRLRNTIVARNIDGGGEGPDCAGRVSSYGYNLLQSTAGCMVSNITTGNRVGVDPLLGPLELNGGPTPARALLPGSPAIDRGHPGSPGSGGNTCLRVDQRGLRRPKDGDGAGGARCDIGAFERQSAGAEATDQVEDGAEPALESDPGQGGAPSQPAWDPESDAPADDGSVAGESGTPEP